MRQRWLWGATAAAWIAAGIVGGIVWAKPGVVTTTDGGRFQGEITKKNDQVIVTIHGIDTTIPRQNVAEITYPGTFDKQFADKLAKLDPNDVEGRIALARWAFDQQQYNKAREALDAAMQIDPNNREAADLQNLITSQVRLETNKNAATQVSTQSPADAAPPNPIGVERKMLTAADVNVIRQKELGPADARVGIRFDNNVDKRFVQFAQIQLNQFNALMPAAKAATIVEKGDESMKPDVKVLSDPTAIMEYRRVIQPTILTGCASANCHGGSKGGKLTLYSPADNDLAAYTNFYILSQFKKKISDASASTFTAPERRMIDRGQGIHSLLAQYSLPAAISEIDHPHVQGYDGVFHSPNEPRFRQMVEWMDHSLKQPEPDYGIKFEPPHTKAVTQPSSRPADMNAE